MGKRRVPCALWILFALFFTRDVLADTGGSMGGGDWSRSGGGRSGGGGGYAGGGSYSNDDSDSSDDESAASTWRRDFSKESSGWSWSSKRSSDKSKISDDSSSDSDTSSDSDSNSNHYYSSSNRYSSSDDSSSSDSSSYRSGHDELSSLLAVVAVIVGGVLLVVIIGAVTDWWRWRSLSRLSNVSFGLEDTTQDLVDVTVLRITVDGRARKFVQTRLARIAETADTRTAGGRVDMLREVSLVLRRVRGAWVYGGAVNEPMRDIGSAKPVFDKHVDDARWKFLEERIRVMDGDITRRDSSEYHPRSDEGDGLILVSIIIAARRELFTVNRIGDGDDLRIALETTGWIGTDSLVALEVVWQPYEDSDRLSSMELEAKYPRPEIIPITGALVGKVFCTYCGGPFPAELVSCPHCGAPAPDREAPKAA